MVAELERRQKMELEAQKAKEVIANAILTCTKSFILPFFTEYKNSLIQN